MKRAHLQTLHRLLNPQWPLRQEIMRKDYEDQACPECRNYTLFRRANTSGWVCDTCGAMGGNITDRTLRR